MLSNLKKLKAGLRILHVHNAARWRWAPRPAALFARTRPELASPDIKCSISPFSADRPQDGLHPWSGFTTIVYQLRPESRGEIKLKAPTRPIRRRCTRTIWRPRPTSEPSSTGSSCAAGSWRTRRCNASSRRSSCRARRCESDDELLDYARRRGGTVYHPTSTCKMGVDAMAVVDPELRVHGIEGLRVADASIMPTVVSGNTNAATIMIGESVADMVRQQVRLSCVALGRCDPRVAARRAGHRPCPIHLRLVNFVGRVTGLIIPQSYIATLTPAHHSIYSNCNSTRRPPLFHEPPYHISPSSPHPTPPPSSPSSPTP